MTKLKLSLSAVLLAGVAMMYTACKKSNQGPTNTVDAKTISSQVAVNLGQVLYGGLGGFNVADGTSAPGGVGLSNHNSLKLNYYTNRLKLNSDPSCGAVIDTTLTYSGTLDDGSTASISGRIRFGIICSNGNPTGVTMYDSLKVSASNTQLSAVYNIGENVNMITSDPSNVDANYTFNGSFNVSDIISYKTGTKKTYNETYNYVFQSVVVNPAATGYITSGSATFATKGSNASGTWDYQGTVTFLGNYMAKVVINGKTYTVNLQTGQAS